MTTHSKEPDVLNAVTDDPDKLYDTVLVTYNFQKTAGVKAAIAKGGRGHHRHHCNEDPGGRISDPGIVS